MDLVPRGGADRLGGPEDGATQGVVGPKRLGEEVVHDLFRRVLVHVDLLEDHLPLGIEIRRAEQRVLEHVGEVVHRQLDVLVEDPRVVAGVFLRGEGVHVSTHRVEVLRDVAGRPHLGSLEEQVLEEVTGTADRGRLVAGSCEDPEAERHGADARHPLRDHPQARGELGPLDPH